MPRYFFLISQIYRIIMNNRQRESLKRRLIFLKLQQANDTQFPCFLKSHNQDYEITYDSNTRKKESIYHNDNDNRDQPRLMELVSKPKKKKTFSHVNKSNSKQGVIFQDFRDFHPILSIFESYRTHCIRIYAKETARCTTTTNGF